MSTVRLHLSLVVAALAGSAALAGCGQREPKRVVETPPPSQEQAMPQHEPPPVALSAEDPRASGELAVPVTVPLDDRPQDYWSVTSDQIANTGANAEVKKADAHPAQPIGKNAPPAKSWPSVDAGDLVLPRTITPGRIEDVGDGRELWLMVLPVNFKARSGFDKPLTRIDLAMTLGEAKGDWSILPITDVGYEGLRFGPNPMPDGPFEYWFRSDQLIPALMREEDRMRAGWRLRHADGSQLPAASTWYGVIAAPRGERRAAVTVQARMWFSAGDEATVLLPAQRIGVDFVEPSKKRSRL